FDQPPLDLAGDGDAIFVLLADGSTWQVAPCEAPQRTAWPAVAGAQRLAVDLSVADHPAAWVVVNAGMSDATLHAVHLGQMIPVPFCTDLVIEPPTAGQASRVVVLAQRPGEEFLRWQMDGITPTRLAGLIAPHYDGRGIALAPDGRIAFWTAQGLRHAA